jgi:hypothetical protein
MKDQIQQIAALIQRERRSTEARQIAESLNDDVAHDVVTSFMAEAVKARNNVDGDPVLYVHDSGDVILWANEDDAENDDGSRALERWSVSPECAEALAELDNS